MPHLTQTATVDTCWRKTRQSLNIVNIRSNTAPTTRPFPSTRNPPKRPR